MDKQEKIIIITLVVLLFAFRITSFNERVERVETDLETSHIKYNETETYTESYLKRADLMVHGKIFTEDVKHYKFPPLYSVFLIPTVFTTNDIVYMVLLSILFSSLIIIPIYLLLRKFTTDRISAIVSFLSVFIAPLYFMSWWNTTPYDHSYLFAFLFAWYVYFLYDRDTTKTSIILGLLLLTHYIAIFLIPVSIIWLYKEKRFKGLFQLLAISCTPTILWFIRNGAIHGFTRRGIFGEYFSYFKRGFIDPNMVEERLSNIFDPNTLIMGITVITFFIMFYVILHCGIFIKNKRLLNFYYAMLFNAIVFTPTFFMYSNKYVTYRFFALLSPVYLMLLIFLFVIIREETKGKKLIFFRKDIDEEGENEDT